MGGANFLGGFNKSIPYTKELLAFEGFLYWTLTGGVLCFGLSMLFIKPPNFILPSIVYVIGIIFLWIRYVKTAKKKNEN